MLYKKFSLSRKIIFHQGIVKVFGGSKKQSTLDVHLFSIYCSVILYVLLKFCHIIQPVLMQQLFL